MKTAKKAFNQALNEAMNDETSGIAVRVHSIDENYITAQETSYKSKLGLAKAMANRGNSTFSMDTDIYTVTVVGPTQTGTLRIPKINDCITPIIEGVALGIVKANYQIRGTFYRISDTKIKELRKRLSSMIIDGSTTVKKISNNGYYIKSNNSVAMTIYPLLVISEDELKDRLEKAYTK